MRLQKVCASAAPLVIPLLAALAGCNGQIGNTPSGAGGSGTGNATGSGTAGSVGTGTAGAGNGSGGSGTGGSSVPGQLNLNGSPKYYRVVRLTNAQWAAAVQTVLNVSSGGLEQNFSSPVTGTTDFSNNELHLGLDSRNWADYQSAAEAQAAQVTATDAALAKVYSGTDAAGLITTLGETATTTAMRQFHGEWLHFDDYALISKAGVSNYTTALNPELQEASYRFFDNIFTQGLGVKDMLLSTSRFYGPQMAKLYGLTAPASGTYAQADLGTNRVGYFS